MCEESISLDTNAAPLCIVCAVSFALSEASRGNIKGWIQYNVKGKLTASLEEKVYTFWPIRLLPVQIETGEYENKKLSSNRFNPDEKKYLSILLADSALVSLWFLKHCCPDENPVLLKPGRYKNSLHGFF